MNSDAMNFLKKFSSKKDALAALNEILEITEVISNLDDAGLAYDRHWSIREAIMKHEDVDLAQNVLDFFNQSTGKNYQNTEKIKAVIRQIPKVTFSQFQSIILHKCETWGTDDKMKQYLRPATLFGSKQKFLTYLEDATDYWIQKQKRQ